MRPEPPPQRAPAIPPAPATDVASAPPTDRAPDLASDRASDLAEAFEVVRRLLGAEPSAAGDPRRIADHLYTHWFHGQQGDHLRHHPAAGAFAAVTTLEHRYAEGWVLIGHGPDGVLAEGPGGVRRRYAPLDVAPIDPVSRPQPGAPLRVLDRATGTVDGFWHLWSGGWRTAPPDEVDRLYLAVAAVDEEPGRNAQDGHGHALELRVAATLADAAPPGEVWYAKFLTGPHRRGRCDPALLYLPAGGATAAWVPRFLASIAPYLTSSRVRMSTVHAPGVSLARDPGGGRSFGQAWCEDLAAVIERSAPPDLASFLAAVGPGPDPLDRPLDTPLDRPLDRPLDGLLDRPLDEFIDERPDAQPDRPHEAPIDVAADARGQR